MPGGPSHPSRTCGLLRRRPSMGCFPRKTKEPPNVSVAKLDRPFHYRYVPSRTRLWSDCIPPSTSTTSRARDRSASLFDPRTVRWTRRRRPVTGSYPALTTKRQLFLPLLSSEPGIVLLTLRLLAPTRLPAATSSGPRLGRGSSCLRPESLAAASGAPAHTRGFVKCPTSGRPQGP